MKLHLFTIVLDGMPYIKRHLDIFTGLQCDWHWTIAEGAAMNILDTAWCKPQSPRLSRDGTTEYLNSIRNHPNVSVIQRQKWNGKVEQCNACLPKQECVLMQVDVDEIWNAQSLQNVLAMFCAQEIGAMQFRCRYFLGPDIVITSDDCYGNRDGEWMRAWKFHPGMKFLKHEPPTLSGIRGGLCRRDDHGITFDHFAYATEAQLRYKEKFYGYADALNHWKKLQANTVWPCHAKTFLPWVNDNSIADKITA